MPEIPEREPTVLTAGDTWRWTTAFDGYPSSDWDLTYYLRKVAAGAAVDGENFLTIEAEAEGDDIGFSVEVGPDDNDAMESGDYVLTATVEGEDGRKEVGTWPVYVKPDPADGLDPRPTPCQILDAITAQLSGNASEAVQSYTVHGRSITRYTSEELIDLRNQYSLLCQQAKDRLDRLDGKKGSSIVHTKFKNPQ